MIRHRDRRYPQLPHPRDKTVETAGAVEEGEDAMHMEMDKAI